MKILLKLLAIITILCGCATDKPDVAERLERLETLQKELTEKAGETKTQVSALSRRYKAIPAKQDIVSRKDLDALVRKQEQRQKQAAQLLEETKGRLEKAEKRAASLEKALSAMSADRNKQEELQLKRRRELSAIRADLRKMAKVLQTIQKQQTKTPAAKGAAGDKRELSPFALQAIAERPYVETEERPSSGLTDADAKAIEAYRKAVEMYPDHANTPEALCAIGDIYEKAGMHDEALKAYREVIKKYPSSHCCDRAYFHVGEILLGKGKLDEAKDALAMVVHGYPASPFRPQALLHMARADRKAKQWDEAIKRYRYVVEAYPGKKPALTAYQEIGDLLYSLKRYREAREAFEHASCQTTETTYLARLRFMTARCLMMLGEYEKARRDFHQIEKRFCNTSAATDATFAMAESYYREGKSLEAVQSYRRAVERYPDDKRVVPSLVLMGSSCLSSNLYDEAIDSYRKVLTICVFKRKTAPKLYDRYSAEAQFGIGNSFYGKEDYASAERALRDLLKQFPESPASSAATALLADCLRRQDKFDEAVEMYDLAIEKNTKASSGPQPMRVAEAYFWKGDCFQRKGSHRKAAASYQEAVRWARRLKDDKPAAELAANAMLNRAGCLAKLNDTKEAIAQYEQVVQGFKDTIWSAAAAYRIAGCKEDIGASGDAFKAYSAFAQKYQETDVPEIEQLVRQATWHAQRLDWSKKHRPQFESFRLD